jgi:hypothetical protein
MLDRRQWMELINTHASLSSVPPAKGINPFTRQPDEFKAPGTTARVLIGGAGVGIIECAADDSGRLDVHADEGSVADVMSVAEDLATRLGARFVRGDAGH